MSFKAHDDRGGARLGRQLALGAVGMARRYEEVVGAAVIELEVLAGRVEAARVALTGVSRGLPTGSENGTERSVSERGTGAVSGASDAEVKALARDLVEAAEPFAKRGRPRIEGERPWELEGVSRRTWFRRRQGSGG